MPRRVRRFSFTFDSSSATNLINRNSRPISCSQTTSDNPELVPPPGCLTRAVHFGCIYSSRLFTVWPPICTKYVYIYILYIYIYTHTHVFTRGEYHEHCRRTCSSCCGKATTTTLSWRCCGSSWGVRSDWTWDGTWGWPERAMKHGWEIPEVHGPWALTWNIYEYMGIIEVKGGFPMFEYHSSTGQWSRWRRDGPCGWGRLSWDPGNPGA